MATKERKFEFENKSNMDPTTLEEAKKNIQDFHELKEYVVSVTPKLNDKNRHLWYRMMRINLDLITSRCTHFERKVFDEICKSIMLATVEPKLLHKMKGLDDRELSYDSCSKPFINWDGKIPSFLGRLSF